MSLADQFAQDAGSTPVAPQQPSSLAQQFSQDASAASKPAPIAASEEKPTPATGTFWQDFAAGYGGQTVGLWRRMVQLAGGPAEYLESKFPGISQWSQEKLGMPSAIDADLRNQHAIDESRIIDAPLQGTSGGFLGGLTGGTVNNLALAAAGGPTLLMPKTYAAAAGAGALQGLSQPVATGESGALNTATGAGLGAAGNFMVNALGNIAQPAARLVSAAHDKAVSVLQSVGIPLDAAQQSGSAFLGKLRSSFFDNPFTAGAQSDLADTQRKAFNQAVLNTVGENANVATPEVMNRADSRIGNIFKNILGRNNVQITDDALSHIGAVQAAAASDEKNAVVNHANRIINSIQPDGTIPGQTAYNIKKDLDRLASPQADTTLIYHARQLRSVLMDTINDSLSPQDQSAFSQARGQFANLKKIEPTIDRMGNGDISPAKLANVFAQKGNRSISVYGRGPQDLYDLAQAGNMLLPDRNPNSGTASRLFMGALPAVAGGAFGAGVSRDEAHPLGNITDIGKGAAMAYAIPKVAQYMLNNPATARYISGGLPQGMVRNAMQAPQTYPALGAVLRRIPYEAEAQP